MVSETANSRTFTGRACVSKRDILAHLVLIPPPHINQKIKNDIASKVLCLI